MKDELNIIKDVESLSEKIEILNSVVLEFGKGKCFSQSF